MKRFRNVILCLLVSLVFIPNVLADSGNISVVSNARVAVVGSTFTVTVTVNASDALGSWKFGLSYDSSYVAYQSGSPLTVADYGNGSAKSRQYTYTFKALKSGNARIGIQDASMVLWKDAANFVPINAGAVTVSVKTQAEIQASYSKDNNLKSLGVEGYEITPAFDKNTLEYSVSVPDTVEKINVQAARNDTRAHVTGTGEHDISEGANKIEIVVTAENGSIKTYTLNVEVRDLNPIAAKVDGKDYTVVKKDTLLSEPTGFVKTTVKIDDIEVPAFKSERAGLTVVGLKDTSGNIGMYLYDEDKKTFGVYNELKNASMNLLPIEIESVPEGFSKDKLKINGIECEVMKSDMAQDFYLIYAMNVETGDKDYYQFDKETNAFMKYNSSIFDSLNKEKQEFLIYLFALAGICGVQLLLVICMSARVSKLKKLLRKVSKPRMEEKGAVPSQAETGLEESGEETQKEDIPPDDTEIHSDEVDDDFLELKKRKKKKKKRR